MYSSLVTYLHDMVLLLQTLKVKSGRLAFQREIQLNSPDMPRSATRHAQTRNVVVAAAHSRGSGKCGRNWQIQNPSEIGMFPLVRLQGCDQGRRG